MTGTMTFAEMLTAANDSKVGRNAGQWTPGGIWRETELEMSLLLKWLNAV